MRNEIEETRPFVSISVPLDVVGDTILNWPGNFIMSDPAISTGNVDIALNVKSSSESVQFRATPGVSARVPRGFDCVRVTNTSAQAGKIAFIIIGVGGAEIIR